MKIGLNNFLRKEATEKFNGIVVVEMLKFPRRRQCPFVRNFGQSCDAVVNIGIRDSQIFLKN